MVSGGWILSSSSLKCKCSRILRLTLAIVIATLSNIGSGLDGVGPIDNYSHIAPFGKLVSFTCMLPGGLELFTVLVLIFPTFWRQVT